MRFPGLVDRLSLARDLAAFSSRLRHAAPHTTPPPHSGEVCVWERDVLVRSGCWVQMRDVRPPDRAESVNSVNSEVEAP